MKEQGFPSAACIIKNNKVLLLHRISSFKVWEFPAGGIEFGESPEEAAVREAKEESGLTVKSLGLISVNSNVTPQKHHIIWFCYKCRVLKGIPRAADDEHDKCGWFSYEEMEKMPDLALSVRAFLPQLKKILSD